MLPQAYPIEIAQFIFSILGWVYNVRMLFDVYQDRIFVVSRGLNGRRLITANGEIEQEWYRLGLSSLFLIFGFFSIVTEPPSVIPVLIPLSLETNVIALRWALIIATVIVAFKSFRARRVRRLLDEYPEEEIKIIDRRVRDVGPQFAMEERRKKCIPPE